jgi:hypothetical protein
MRTGDTKESEAPRKVVGRRTLPNLLDPASDTRAAVIAWRHAFPTPFVPKGVYRFASHEEAQEWLTAMLTRSRWRRVSPRRKTSRSCAES